ncbi:hypothetical protein EDD15DRAFT_2566380 [Pisolithus albus]|nr:hypothetical protein EDD15DRAFT_2566380 [Pisolithus albus]
MHHDLTLTPSSHAEIARIEFQIYFRNQTMLVSAVPLDRVKDFLRSLQRDEQHKDVFQDISIAQLKVYRLDPPKLDTEEGKFLEHLKPMEDTDVVELSFGESIVTRRHVCLALILEEDGPNCAIGALKREISACLNITVQRLLRWTMNDVEHNLGGGRYTEHGTPAIPEIVEIQKLLSARRIYERTMEGNPDFELAREYDQELFEKIFTAHSGDCDGGSMVRDTREFSTFYHILRCFSEDVCQMRHQRSSAIKAGHFATYFMQPVFLFTHSDFAKYETGMSWGCPILLGTDAAGDFHRYQAKSDVLFSSVDGAIPLFILEATSMKNESDRRRTLVQAIAAARVGAKVLKKTSEHRFFVVAVCLDKEMVASRYIVTQTGQNRDDPVAVYQKNAVCIHRDDFDLSDNTRAIEFVCEMYNLEQELNKLAGDLDCEKVQALKQVIDSAKNLPLLHSGNDPASGPADFNDEEDDIGVFGADDVQECLLEIDCTIDYCAFGHPNIAIITYNADDSTGYLKFVETSRQNEVEILQFLGGLQSPMNHTISGARFWSVRGGTLITMPVAGGRLTSLERPDEHLWSAASQLVEGVAFMHAHLVAHMDIKPSNIMIPTKGGRLSIIDFSTAIRVKSEKQRYRGVVGTPGYMAPELERGDACKPILADLWSCGRTLEDLCSICEPSADRDFILSVAAKLTSEDPADRPAMSTVQEWFSSRKVDPSAETHGHPSV